MGTSANATPIFEPVNCDCELRRLSFQVSRLEYKCKSYKIDTCDGFYPFATLYDALFLYTEEKNNPRNYTFKKSQSYMYGIFSGDHLFVMITYISIVNLILSTDLTGLCINPF